MKQEKKELDTRTGDQTSQTISENMKWVLKCITEHLFPNNDATELIIQLNETVQLPANINKLTHPEVHFKHQKKDKEV